MPFAKAVVERSRLPGGQIDADRLNVVVVDTLRQLAQLAGIADCMFTELITDVEDFRYRLMSLSAKTTKLAQKLDVLDSLTVTVRTYEFRNFKRSTYAGLPLEADRTSEPCALCNMVYLA